MDLAEELEHALSPRVVQSLRFIHDVDVAECEAIDLQLKILTLKIDFIIVYSYPPLVYSAVRQTKESIRSLLAARQDEVRGAFIKVTLK